MDWAYVSGYFDGEGHVHFKAPPSRPNYILIYLSWSNTHKESLEAIQSFIEAGNINPVGKNRTHKPCYDLVISRVDDILRVGEAMLPHLIVKKIELETMLAWARVNRTSQPDTWGLLTKLGVEEVGRLYHEEGQTQQQIAEKFGLSPGGVSTFFLRNGIKGRRRGPQEGAHGILAQHGTEKLRAMYESGMTIGDIAQELGVRHQTVYMHFYTKGIRVRATKPIRRMRAQRKLERMNQEHTDVCVDRQSAIQQLALFPAVLCVQEELVHA